VILTGPGARPDKLYIAKLGGGKSLPVPGCPPRLGQRSRRPAPESGRRAPEPSDRSIPLTRGRTTEPTSHPRLMEQRPALTGQRPAGMNVVDVGRRMHELEIVGACLVVGQV
jgi:hypothetical protein